MVIFCLGLILKFQSLILHEAEHTLARLLTSSLICQKLCLGGNIPALKGNTENNLLYSGKLGALLAGFIHFASACHIIRTSHHLSITLLITTSLQPHFTTPVQHLVSTSIIHKTFLPIFTILTLQPQLPKSTPPPSTLPPQALTSPCAYPLPLSLSLALSASTVSASPLAYGICQGGGAAVVMACYSAGEATWGATLGATAPATIVACNAAFGTCSATCAALLLAPTP